MANIISTTALFTDEAASSLISERGYNQAKRCIYKGIGKCYEFEALFICNYHASWFDLYYLYRYFMNGDNDSWARTETYARTTANLWIPLFVDKNQTIQMTEVRSFAEKIAKNDPSVKLQDVFDRTLALVGYTPTDFLNYQVSLSGCWLNKPSTQLIVRVADGTFTFAKGPNLPVLHKLLLYHVYPSITYKRRSNDDDQNFMTEKLILSFKEENDSYGFTLINRRAILKAVDPSNPRYVLTPLVLAAEEYCDNEVCLESTFRKTTANQSMDHCP